MLAPRQSRRKRRCPKAWFPHVGNPQIIQAIGNVERGPLFLGTPYRDIGICCRIHDLLEKGIEIYLHISTIFLTKCAKRNVGLNGLGLKLTGTHYKSLWI